MKIVSLKAENIKRLQAVEITPKGHVVKITGKNANGKSSVLDAIWMALGGGDVIPGKPIRDGQEKGMIELDLGDLLVTRKFTEKGSTLVVQNKEKAVFRGPQNVLNELIGKLAFDPMAFMRLKRDEQFRELAEHAGIDFAELDAQRKAKFSDRTDVNRQLKQAQAELKAIDVPEGAPDELTESSKLVQQIEEAQHNNEIFHRLCHKQESLLSRIDELQKLMDQANAELKDVTGMLEGKKETDIMPLRESLENLESRNNAARAKQLHKAKQEQVDRLSGESEALTTALETMYKERLDMIKASTLPVDGLGFGEDCVTFNGIPLDQASSAEQLRVSVAVAMSMNPKLRVIRIEDGSLLDSTSMKIIEDMASAGDFQIWVEQVDESGKIGVVIEDGMVAADNQVEDKA